MSFKKLFCLLSFNRCLHKYIFIGVGWTILLATSLGWNIYQIHESILETAIAAARTSISKDIIFRKWAASHGGIYVPPSKKTPPNPYLKVPKRDVVTTDGEALTLMNPAYMFRELQEHFAIDMGRSHITSLKLLNPYNQADEWETKALQGFEHGSKEFQKIQHINGQPYLRLIQPLIVEQDCLKCHASQGYKVGQIRGGVSTALPLNSYFIHEQKHTIELAISHALIWLSSLIGLYLFYQRENRINQQRKQAEEILRFHSYLLDNMAEGLYLVRVSDQHIVYANPKFEQMFGYQPNELLNKHVSIVNAPSDKSPEEMANLIIAELAEKGAWHGEVQNIKKDGTRFWCSAAVSTFNHPQFGQVWLSVHEDITERKQAEEKLKLNERRISVLLDITNRAGSLTEAQLLQETLDQAESLTNSHIAYAHFVNDDQETLTLGTWSSKTLQICEAAYDSHYPLSQAGIWADCFRQKQVVIHNDYPALIVKKGLPEGHVHVHVQRVMNVPVMEGESVRMIIGVGNKELPYDESDAQELKLIAASLWNMIKRKRSEVSLQKAEEKYRTVADFTFDWETWIDQDEHYRYVSPSCQRFTGYTASEFIEDSSLMFRIVHPDDLQQVKKHFDQGHAFNEQAGKIEFRIITKTGEIRWIEHICQPIIKENGNYLGRRASNRDISDRKLAEETLQIEKEKYYSLVDNIQAGIVVHAADSSILISNVAAQTMLGLSEDQIRGKTALDPAWHFFREDGSVMPVEEYPVSQVLQNRQPLRDFVIGVHRSDNKSDIWALVNADPIFDEGDNLLQTVITFIDITARKQAEDALRKTQDSLNEAQHIAQVGNWELNLVNNSLFWSDEIFHIFEIDQHRFPATYEAFLAAIHPEDREAVNKAYLTSLEKREPYSITHRLLMSDGRIKYVHEQCQTFYDTTRKPMRSVGTVQDITKRVLAEQELEHYRRHLETLVQERTAALLIAKEKAEAASRAKSVFIATMSHEFRTPLNAILGFSQLIMQDKNTPQKQKDTLAIIHRNGLHLLNLINDVLDISNIETGHLELSLQDFDLLKLLQEISVLVKTQAENKGLQFELDIAPNLPHYIQSDADKLRRILLNLLENAVKFTTQGQVKLHVQALALPVANQALLEIEVIDSGAGIPKQQLSDLFKPFVQLARRDCGLEGTGLGLVIVKSLIEILNGSISVESVLGIGSTFKITLPVILTDVDNLPMQPNNTWQALEKKAVEQQEITLASPTEKKITQEVVRQLPLPLLQQLHETAVLLDIEQIEIVIQQIAKIAPDIAASLQKLAENYQFDQIMQLTQAPTD